MKLLWIGSMIFFGVPVVASAQYARVPNQANGIAATAVGSVGNAAAAVPRAHEVGAQVVAPSLPAAAPFAAGVTTGTAAIAGGIQGTSRNIRAGGIQANLGNTLSPQRVQNQAKAVNQTVNQAKSAVPKSDELKCDATELLSGECPS